jgi:uncharacterized protein YjbI with pentapeptide repeats
MTNSARRPPVAGQRRRTPAIHDAEAGGTEHAGWSTVNVVAAVIVAIATLAATIGGLYFNADSSRKGTEQARQAIAAQTSERFSRSVEQLGSGSIAVRIGAVYSFGRLMRDSRDDQQSIVEILSAFVRLQAAKVPATLNVLPQHVPHQFPFFTESTRRSPADLLAALRVLDDQPRPRSRTNSDGSSISWPSMLLSAISLARIDLHDASMRGADLSNSDFSLGFLHGVDWAGADLHLGRLMGAGLQSADLTDADLTDADLTGAVLVDANLEGAHLMRANLSPSDLPHRNQHTLLLDAILTGANLTSANLTDAEFAKADLTRANLTGAKLTRAHMDRAKLTGADLNRADLTGADLTNADLTGADVTNADLRGADLSGARLNRLTCDSSTTWPNDLPSPPKCG